MKQDDEIYQEIGGVKSKDTRESTLSSDIKEDVLPQQQEVRHQGQADRHNSLPTTRVLLTKTQSHADTVIACPPHQIPEIQLGQSHHHCSKTDSQHF